MLDPLEAISPLDGRYRDALSACSRYFSEHALIRYRLYVEVRYLRAFAEAVGLGVDLRGLEGLEEAVLNLSLEEAAEVKHVEARVGHDVMAAVEYLGRLVEARGLAALKPHIHFALTSDDVNNIAYALMVRDFIHQTYLPTLTELIEKLAETARHHARTPLLARTHGQPAVPTTLGSFLAKYAYRLARLAEKLCGLRLEAKLGGAVGDLSAWSAVYPGVDWESFAEKFVKSFGLDYNPAPTQIQPHERMSEILSTIALIGSVAANLCRDIWLLGSYGLLVFGKTPEQVHSSTMPQKHNPLHFENAEGASDLSTAILTYISTRLIQSRLHRDLSDSIIKRFYGTALALNLLALKNIKKGLTTLTPDTEKMRKEIENNKHTLLEAVQLTLRKHGLEDGYRLAATAAVKGIEWLRTELETRGISGTLLDRILDEGVEAYVAAAAEKTAHLVEHVENMVKKVREAMISLSSS